MSVGYVHAWIAMCKAADLTLWRVRRRSPGLGLRAWLLHCRRHRSSSSWRRHRGQWRALPGRRRWCLPAPTSSHRGPGRWGLCKEQCMDPVAPQSQSTCEVMTVSQWCHKYHTLWYYHCDITSISQGPHAVRHHAMTTLWSHTDVLISISANDAWVTCVQAVNTWKNSLSYFKTDTDYLWRNIIKRYDLRCC